MYQAALPLLKSVCPPRPAEMPIVATLPTFRSSLRHSIDRSGLAQEDIAENLVLDVSSFSRMIRDPRHASARPREFPHDKLADFCLLTGSIAAVQWHAFRLGYALVPLRDVRGQNLERDHAADRARAWEEYAA